MYKNIFAYIFCVKKIEVVTKMIKILRNPDLDERKNRFWQNYAQSRTISFNYNTIQQCCGFDLLCRI